MPKTIEQYYDFLSSVYDQKTPEFARLPCKKAVEIIQRNEITNVGKLLDLWCGTGQVLDELITANISNDGYVWIDISSKMIEIIKTKYPDIKTSKIDIEEKFDTVKWKFDTIIMIWLFEFLTKKDYVLNHICDKLKKWWYFCLVLKSLWTDIVYKEISILLWVRYETHRFIHWPILIILDIRSMKSKMSWKINLRW